MTRKLLISLTLPLLFSGCVMAYDSGKTQRSWVISIASKSNVDSLKTGKGISIRRGKTEAQPEAIKAISEGAAKGVTGNPLGSVNHQMPNFDDEILNLLNLHALPTYTDAFTTTLEGRIN